MLVENDTIQFGVKQIKREVNEAFIAFKNNIATPAPPVATGNWGCGMFHGDNKLKFLIQLIAARLGDRHMMFHTFFDKNQQNEYYVMAEFLKMNYRYRLEKCTPALLASIVKRMKETNFLTSFENDIVIIYISYNAAKSLCERKKTCEQPLHLKHTTAN